MKDIYDVVVIGAGAAGMMAACTCAKRKLSTLVIEQMKQEGSKILVTGKGRCNITNDCDPKEVIANVMSNGSFLYSAIYGFTPADIIEFFNSIGVETVTERGRRVFPKSGKAIDVRNALAEHMKACKAAILKDHKVTGISKSPDGEISISMKDKNNIDDMVFCHNCIIATGGMSYRSTGSDGSGYELARQLGHTIIPLKGALTGLNTYQKWVSGAMGLTLKNVSLTLYKDNRELFKEQGELLLTHFGISGPIVLTGSRYLLDTDYKNCKAVIDLKPALDEETLYKRITKDLEENSNKQFINSLDALLPQSLIPIIVKLSDIDPDKKSNQISREEKNALVILLKHLTLDVKSGMDIDDAVVTKGGVSVKEINPSTMESKIFKNVYFAGEIIDVDALTGGYNLTIAFATGRLAGKSIDVH